MGLLIMIIVCLRKWCVGKASEEDNVEMESHLLEEGEVADAQNIVPE